MTKKNFSAVGDWVFIKRDEQETTHRGLDISDGAQVQSYKGTVVSAGNDSSLSAGDAVHVPARQVSDYEIYGEKLSVVKHGELFAKIEDAAVSPINRYVHVLKCLNEHETSEDGDVLLYRTDKYINTTNWVEVLGVADDCESIGKEHVGMFCVSPEVDDKLHRVGYGDEWMVHESLIGFMVGD